MELLKGQDLQKAMRTPPPMPLEQKISIIVQVLAGLAHAHQAGIVHRDIKPANIFINDDGTVKIMDFGVARLTTASMTGTGNIVGTADYMSPEQVKGAKVDGRSDLFSVGCHALRAAAPAAAPSTPTTSWRSSTRSPTRSRTSTLLPRAPSRRPAADPQARHGQGAVDPLPDGVRVRGRPARVPGTRHASAARALEGLLERSASGRPQAVLGATVVEGDAPSPDVPRGAHGARAPPHPRSAADRARRRRAARRPCGRAARPHGPSARTRPAHAAPRAGSKAPLVGGAPPGGAVVIAGVAAVDRDAARRRRPADDLRRPQSAAA